MIPKAKQTYPKTPVNETGIRELADSSMPLNLRLTNNFAFLTTFHNRTALTGLLSALLEIDASEILDLEFPDRTLTGEYAEDREGILDVKVVMNGDRKINIEIQVLPFKYWEERSLFYLSKYFLEGFEKGQSYGKLVQSCISSGEFCTRYSRQDHAHEARRRVHYAVASRTRP